MTIENLLYLKQEFISPGTLLALKIIFSGVSLLLLFCILYFTKKTSWLRWRHAQDVTDFFSFSPYGVKKIEKTWAKIIQRLGRPSESEYKLAIIEADSLLNEILERMGYQGESLGERLKKITADILPAIQEIWQAHKIRNNIVHDPDYKITLDQAKNTIKNYEKALQDLNVF